MLYSEKEISLEVILIKEMYLLMFKDIDLKHEEIP